MKNYWLVKSEPNAYSWSDLVKEKKTSWTGVRNFTARNNLRGMRVGDEVLFYHSVTEKAVVGVAKVIRAAYSDPTAKEGDWITVDLAPSMMDMLAAHPRSIPLCASAAPPTSQISYADSFFLKQSPYQSSLLRECVPSPAPPLGATRPASLASSRMRRPFRSSRCRAI